MQMENDKYEEARREIFEWWRVRRKECIKINDYARDNGERGRDGIGMYLDGIVNREYSRRQYELMLKYGKELDEKGKKRLSRPREWEELWTDAAANDLKERDIDELLKWVRPVIKEWGYPKWYSAELYADEASQKEE